LLKIRLSRTGKKGQPSFRIVVQEHTAAVKGGKVVEVLGYYLPTVTPKKFEAKQDRVDYWLSVGARPSDTLASLLKREGVQGMDKFLDPRKKKAKKKKEVEEKPAAAPVVAKVEEAPAPAAEAPVVAPVVETPAPEAPTAPEEVPAEETPAKEETAQ